MYTIPVPLSKATEDCRRRIGHAIYLLLYLIHKCNWESRKLTTSLEDISSDSGFPPGTVRKWMKLLENAGEVHLLRTPHDQGELEPTR